MQGNGASGTWRRPPRRGNAIEVGARFRRSRNDLMTETAEVERVYADLSGIQHVRYLLHTYHPIRGRHCEGRKVLALTAFARQFSQRVPDDPDAAAGAT